LQLLKDALELALQREFYAHEYQAGQVLAYLVFFRSSRDLVRARELALQALEIDDREHFLPGEAGSVAWLSYLDWLKGDWSAAFDEVERALEMAQRLGFTNYPILLGEVSRGLIRLSMGDSDEAEKYLENSNVKQSPLVLHVVSFNLALRKVRLEQGREDEARACFETCVDKFKTNEFNPLSPHQIEALLHLTAIYAKHGQLGEARRMSEWAKRLAETLKGDAGLAMASQAEAAFLLASGDQKGAEEAYLKSLDLWEKAGWPYYHAKALIAYSEALAQKNPEESRKRLEEAAEIFQKLGAKRDIERTQAKLSAG